MRFAPGLALFALLTAQLVRADAPRAAQVRWSSPEHLRKRPWPRGYSILDGLGIYARLPPGADDDAEPGGPVHVTWPGPRSECKMTISAAHDPAKADRIVGAQPIVCLVEGEGCPAGCPPLRPMTSGGKVLPALPDDLPVLTVEAAFGDRSSDQHELSLWRDGTVHANGGKSCWHFRGRRGRLPAERVAALLDALQSGGGFERRSPPRARDGRDPECEHSVLTLSMRWNGREARLQSDCDPPRWFRDMLDHIDQVVGPNPCD